MNYNKIIFINIVIILVIIILIITIIIPRSLASASSQPSSSSSEKNKWYYCSKEGSFCNTKGKIKYGANNHFYYNKLPNGTFHLGSGSQCNNILFGGDPAPGFQKHCWTDLDIALNENKAIHVPKMVMIVPGYGLPHIETKRVILENNIKMFGNIPPDVIVCQYNGEPLNIPNVTVYYEEGFVGAFLKKHHPYIVKHYDIIMIIMDDILIQTPLNYEMIENMLKKYDVISPSLLNNAIFPHMLQEHVASTQQEVVQTQVLELLCYIMTKKAFDLYAGKYIVDYNPYMWSMDFILTSVMKLRVGLLRDYHLLHFFRMSYNFGPGPEEARHRYLAEFNKTLEEVSQQRPYILVEQTKEEEENDGIMLIDEIDETNLMSKPERNDILLDSPTLSPNENIYQVQMIAGKLSASDLWCEIYGWCTRKRRNEQRIGHKAIKLNGLQIIPPTLHTNALVDVCYRYPATSKYNAKCATWDGFTAIGIDGFHVDIGKTHMAVWVQEKGTTIGDSFGNGNSKILSKVLIHEFCVIPEDLKIKYYCTDNNDKSKNNIAIEPFKLSTLPSIQLDGPEFVNTISAKLLLSELRVVLKVHRFKQYDTNLVSINDGIAPTGNSIESFETIVINNSTIDMNLLKQFSWQGNKYRTDYFGVLVEIPNGYVTGEFIFDRNALYMHHGCNLDFSIYRPHSIGDEIFFNLPDRSHHSKLIVIRSWLSVGYYHLLTEAAPRIMYVLELLQKDPTIQLLIDPAIYNSPNGIRRPDKELFLELLEIRKNQIVEYDEAVVYSADILFVPSGTPCENTAPALIRDWSQLLREKQKQRQNYNLQHNNRNNIVVIIRANVISHKGEQFTDDVLKNIRSHDDMLRSEILIQKLKTRFGDKYPIKRFYGNITLMETSKLFASAIAVIGRSGAGFSNLIFAEPSTVVMMVIANRVLEYCVYQNKNILSSSQHIGLALKLGMIPRMIIAENLAGNDGASYPYATVVNELESVLG